VDTTRAAPPVDPHVHARLNAPPNVRVLVSGTRKRPHGSYRLGGRSVSPPIVVLLPLRGEDTKRNRTLRTVSRPLCSRSRLTLSRTLFLLNPSR